MRLVNGDLLKDRINRLRMYLARIEGNLDSALITCFQEVIEGNSCPEYKTKQSNPLLLAGALAPNPCVGDILALMFEVDHMLSFYLFSQVTQ